MDGIAAARALTSGRQLGPLPGRHTGRERFVIGTATARDDLEIRALLRETSFPGRVRLTFEREPDSLSARIEGDVHDVIVARERSTGRLAGIAARSSRLRYVNGVPVRVGYLGQLRIAPGFSRSRELLDAGFRFCRTLQQQDPVRMYLASVVADNSSVRRLLERGAPGWPLFRPVDEIATLAIPTRGVMRRARPRGLTLGAGSTGPQELSDVLARNNARSQFAPVWEARTLCPLPGLTLSDFIVALRDGEIAGCAALWDQRAFKQVVVRGYSAALTRWRPLINVIRPLVGVPALPRPGSPLAFAHVSHLAVDDDDPDVAVALVAAVRRAARARALDYVAVGLSSRSALARPIRRAFAHRSYPSILYAAAWADDEAGVHLSDPCRFATAEALDGRPAYPEIAIL